MARCKKIIAWETVLNNERVWESILNIESMGDYKKVWNNMQKLRK